MEKKEQESPLLLHGDFSMLQYCDGGVGEFSKLPTDIFLDILSRVPLKPLSRCNCVSKAWYNLIHHPCLAQVHYTRSLQYHPSPFVIFFDRCKQFLLIDHQVFDNLETSPPLLRVERFQDFDSIFDMVGSVNGLVCFSPDTWCYTGKPYYIWNPVTGEYVSLPRSPKIEEPHRLSGFAFDSATNEYKVIRFLKNSAQAEVYTLGSDSWRHIPSVPRLTYGKKSNVLVNGSLHWLTHENGFIVILSFNVGTEEFHRIKTPSCINLDENIGVDIWKCYLGVLGGCLCCVIVYDDSVNKENEIWVMKEYGVQGSWVKEYICKRKFMVSPCEGGYAVTKLSNDEFLFQSRREELGYYDPKTEVFRPIFIENRKKLFEGSYAQALVHAGSLFSPKHVGRLTNR